MRRTPSAPEVENGVADISHVGEGLFGVVGEQGSGDAPDDNGVSQTFDERCSDEHAGSVPTAPPTRSGPDESSWLRAEVKRLAHLLATERPVVHQPDLRAPVPYFGSKRLAAPIMWRALGDVPNLVIGFAGSLSELLARPAPGKVETVNDRSGLVANFWRAVQADPDAVAAAADQPVIEVDLHAWHARLTSEAAPLRERLEADPEYFDAVLAGRWAWGASAWLGGGWCDGKPHRRRPALTGRGGTPQVGWGVHRDELPQHRAQLPSLSGGGGTGVGYGRGVHQAEGRRAGLIGWFRAIADRLRFVRIICGDFERVLSPAVTTSHGLSGVILDPPYTPDERCHRIYEVEDAKDLPEEMLVARRAARWAREHGDDPLLRIVLCGFEGEHDMPATWRCVPWKSHGGYGLQAQGRGRANRERERLWLSPHCLRDDAPLQLDLVGGTGR